MSAAFSIRERLRYDGYFQNLPGDSGEQIEIFIFNRTQYAILYQERCSEHNFP